MSHPYTINTKHPKIFKYRHIQKICETQLQTKSKYQYKLIDSYYCELHNNITGILPLCN